KKPAQPYKKHPDATKKDEGGNKGSARAEDVGRLIHVRLQRQLLPKIARISRHVTEQEEKMLLTEVRDPKVVPCLERRMKLDRVQHQHRAGRQHKNYWHCGAMEQPAQAHPFNWKRGHRQ